MNARHRRIQYERIIKNRVHTPSICLNVNHVNRSRWILCIHRCSLSFRSRETWSGDDPVMCRMRETNYGSVPAECFGPGMARRVCPLLRLQNHVTGQVFLQGSEAVLQRGFLQVGNLPTRLLSILGVALLRLRALLTINKRSCHWNRLIRWNRSCYDQFRDERLSNIDWTMLYRVTNKTTRIVSEGISSYPSRFSIFPGTRLSISNIWSLRTHRDDRYSFYLASYKSLLLSLYKLISTLKLLTRYSKFETYFEDFFKACSDRISWLIASTA